MLAKYIKNNKFSFILFIYLTLFLSSILAVLSFDIYSTQSLTFNLDNTNSTARIHHDNLEKSDISKISNDQGSGFICNVFNDHLESSCKLEIWISESKTKGIDISKFENMEVYGSFETPTEKDALRVSFRNYEPDTQLENIELYHKHNLIELIPSEIADPIYIDINRLIVPNWWYAKVREEDINSEVDLTNITHIELATGLHVSTGEYQLIVSSIKLNRQVLTKENLYKYLLIQWTAIIILSFISISFYFRVKIKEKLHNKQILEEINESLSIRSEELKIKNQTDELTGVFNRNAMEAQFNKCLKNNWYPMTVVMLDIDYFKKINDNYGHQKGDHVLISLGKILNNFIQENESVTRFGGEEFLIILPQLEHHQIKDRLEQLRQTIEAFDMKLDYAVTASIGCATCNNFKEFTLVIEHADKALYAAKNNGRNCVEFYKED